jgi:hypothetical protein
MTASFIKIQKKKKNIFLILSVFAQSYTLSLKVNFYNDKKIFLNFSYFISLTSHTRKTNGTMKKITLDELQTLLESEKGATFAGLTYFVDESKSKTVKGKKAVQKEVEQVATLRSSYKIGRAHV